jgi:PKD repeat protein
MTYAWDFSNDGSVDSTQGSPSHIYTAAGTYTVKLTVTNGAGSDTILKTRYITVIAAPSAPTADFISNKQSGTAPLTVTFTDQSTGTTPMTYAWDFDNDGVNESISKSPTFTYSNPGTYSVKLTTTNDLGSDTELKTGYITVNPVIKPTAAFTANKQSGTTPLTVRFTDQSTGTTPMTYAWDFNNDGINDSTTQNPSFTYTNTGTYSVKLTATNSAGSDAEIMTDYITVNEAPPGSTHAGIALTFDDNAVTNWYAIQDLLKKYNAHATFYVSSFGGRSEDEINMLKTMKENGHEIAFHGAHHTDVNEYLSDHSIEEYLNYEIIPGIDLMKNAGLDPVDFAYPYGSENDDVTSVLETYFIHIRGTAYRESGKLKDVDSVFYQYGSNKAHIYGIGIDDITYGNSLDDIYDGILRAKNEDKILIFYAHTPVASNPQSYQISHDRLEKILINASENDMKFYKISEIN